MGGIKGWGIVLCLFSAASCRPLCYEPVRPLLDDFVGFNKNLISCNTLKITVITAPFYGLSRLIDPKIHHCFYCPRHHKNRHQMPRCLYYGVDVGLGVLMVSLGLLSFLPESHLQRTARLYAVTLPYTWAVKKLLKKAKVGCCERPKNEWFCKNKVYYGGCPSGHMMEIVYTAALFGTQLGPSFGIPLGLFAAGISINFLNCNRHYLSQLVAGASLGLIFASAANSVLQREQDDFSCAFVPDDQGCAVRAAYRF